MNKRYERKFLLPLSSSINLETIIKLHPLIFKEIYYKRTVNNVYFDTHNLKFFQDNVDGNSDRMKIRLRWYDNLKVANKPKIEFKIKDGLLGSKIIYLTKDFNLDKFIPNINEVIKNTPDITVKKLETISPVLCNSYDRKYFQSDDGNFRITIDTNLDFYSVSNSKVDWKSKWTMPSTIMELKYDQEFDDIADRVSSFFTFRLSKSSKYVLGLAKLNGYDY
jgi:SPX domain protein involved in polyphosphate accumulation